MSLVTVTFLFLWTARSENEKHHKTRTTRLPGGALHIELFTGEALYSNVISENTFSVLYQGDMYFYLHLLISLLLPTTWRPQASHRFHLK